MSDEVVSVRLRRNTTSTPWGFRMQGGHEYGTPLCISQVNPKSLSNRLGLRLGDRLLAIGSVQAHNMSHEQAKMEIIRAGNELDLIVQRSASAVIDQPDSRPVHRSQRPDPVEESTEYRGYTNPNVQSRSFKILQESLNYSEANEEGIVLPTGNTPGEGIVRKAYSEGRRRLEELSEINPRNFTDEGESPYRVSEHYNTREDGLISERSAPHDVSVKVVAAKVYDGSEPSRRERPTVNIAQSSALSPAAGQQQYLQQAHEHYATKHGPEPQQRERPTVNIAHSSVLSPAAGQQQYLQQAHQHYETKSQVQKGPEQVPQQTVVRRQRPKERQLKLVNYQFEEQYGHLSREAGSAQAQQQGQVIQINKQKAVVSPQKSGDFIPATEMVESVAADLHLKIVSPGTAPQQGLIAEQSSTQSQKQIVKQAVVIYKPTEPVVKSVEQTIKPTEQISKPAEPVVKSVEQTIKPTEQISKPAEPVVKSVEQTIKPTEQISKPTEQVVKPAEQTVKPEEQIVKPADTKIIPKTEDQGSEVTEVKGKVVQTNQVQTVVVQSDITQTNKRSGRVETVTDGALNKFAEELSVSVVASAQQSVQTPPIVEKATSDELDGGLLSKETTVQQDQKNVETQPTQQTESVSEQETQQKEVQSLELVQVSLDESKSDQQQSSELKSESQADQEGTAATIVVAQDIQTEQEKVAETIPTAVEQELQPADEVNTELSVDVTEPTEAGKETENEQVSFTVEEVEEANTQPEDNSTEIVQQSEIETVTLFDQKEAEVVEQAVNIGTDVQSEEQSFSFSVEENKAPEETTAESAELTFELSANATEAESSAAFEISTETEISLDVSSDITFTTDASADITSDVSQESDEAVTIALEPEAKEVESAAVTIPVAKDEEESKPEAKQPGKLDEPKQNKQNESKPTRAKFVDSQGGVAARLARLKQK